MIEGITIEDIMSNYGLTVTIFLFMFIGGVSISSLFFSIVLFYYSRKNNMKYILTLIGIILFVIFIDSLNFSIENNYIIINALISIVGVILGLGMAAVVFLTVVTKA